MAGVSAEDLQKMTVIVKTHHGSDLRDGVIGGVQKGYGGLNSVFGQILLGGDAKTLQKGALQPGRAHESALAYRWDIQRRVTEVRPDVAQASGKGAFLGGAPQAL